MKQTAAETAMKDRNHGNRKPAGTGRSRGHRLPEAGEVNRNLPIQVAALFDTTGKLHPLWFRYAD